MGLFTQAVRNSQVIMSEQTERAFQKQAPIFQNKKRVIGKASKSKDQRFVKSVGLGFKTPREATEGIYIDKKCPFTGNEYSRSYTNWYCAEYENEENYCDQTRLSSFIKKYQRYEKRHKTLAAHMSPCFRDVQLGDLVTVGQCRPLSKTVRFNVLKVTKSVASKKSFEKF